MYSLAIVDDEEGIMTGLKEIFPWSNFGFGPVIGFSDSRVAYKWISTHKTDVLLTDIVMPELDGLSLIEKVQKVNPETKFVILSGYEEFSFAKKGIELGVSEYLVKPVNFDELKAVFTRIYTNLNKKIKRNDQSTLDSILEYVDTNIDTVTLSSLSSNLDLNPYYVSTLFHKIMKIHFSDYVIKKRMEKAATLLINTKLSIQEVMKKTGYTNASSFSRSFRIYWGCSPSDYRINKQ